MASLAPLGDHGGDLYMGDVILHLDQGVLTGQIQRDSLQDSQPDDLLRCFPEAQRVPPTVLVPFHVTVRPISSACFRLHSRIFLSPTTWLKLATVLGSSCYHNGSWVCCQEGTKTEWEAQKYYAKQTNAHVGNVSKRRRGLNVVHRVERWCKNQGCVSCPAVGICHLGGGGA